VAEFDKATGNRKWVRDTSGSTQGVEVMEGQLVIGGHFWEVAVDQEGDKCGSGQDYTALNPDGTPKLDPQDNGDQIVGECATRHGVAAYSFNGDLDLNWSPQYSGSYSLLWTLHAEGSRLHTGGQFKKINGVTQTNYARLSPTVLP
jgi:ribosomal protein L27